MNDDSSIPNTDLPLMRAFKLIRDEVMHEQNVLGTRLTSYITSQAFLLSAYAVSMNSGSEAWAKSYRIAFPIVVCAVGFLLSVRAQPGIADASSIIKKWHQKQDELLDNHPELRLYEPLRRDQTAKIRNRDQWFAQAATLILGIAWILLAALSIYLYSRQ